MFHEIFYGEPGSISALIIDNSLSSLFCSSAENDLPRNAYSADWPAGHLPDSALCLSTGDAFSRSYQK